MPEHGGREIIGARFDSDAKFAYASLPEEEATDFYRDIMNTEPDVPLAAADAENEILYLNKDEQWGLARDAVSEVERPSSDFLDWSWEETAQEASNFDSAEEYADSADIDIELVDTERISELTDLYMERDLPENIETYSITLEEPDKPNIFR